MMDVVDAYPLIDYADLDRVMLYRPGVRITAGRFLAEAQYLADLLAGLQPDRPPAAAPVLNLCQDRYRFMVGLAAAALSGNVSLLPSNHADDTLRHLLECFPDTVCLHDQVEWTLPAPQLAYPTAVPALPSAGDIPALAADQQVAFVFTSGSTGRPVPHAKTWGKLVRNVRGAQAALGLDGAVSIVGTVPPQHMFGLESTVLLCMLGGCPLWSGRPFYPADIVAALAEMPEPRMLVTTPFHLQSLLDSGLAIPPIAQLLLATAPLDRALAERAERQLAAPLREIYGCTETGQIATRRPVESLDWTLFPGVRLDADPLPDDQAADATESGVFRASGGHIEVPIRLADRLDVLPNGRFRLLGRLADQVNIAGKRSALSALTAQLKEIPGVTDGVFFQPDPLPDQAIPRLCALVVAPERTRAEILSALRLRVDPVFLPRPLILVDALPYNETGKLPRAQLQARLDRYRESLKP